MNGKQAKAGNLRQFIFRLLLILSGILLAVFIPWRAWALTSDPHPVQRYEEAVKRIDLLRAERVSEMNPDCSAQFMTHGQKVQDAIVLVHGYTNCPKEFVRLGEKLY